jgi:hypothetical protein
MRQPWHSQNGGDSCQLCSVEQGLEGFETKIIPRNYCVTRPGELCTLLRDVNICLAASSCMHRKLTSPTGAKLTTVITSLIPSIIVVLTNLCLIDRRCRTRTSEGIVVQNISPMKETCHQ